MNTPLSSFTALVKFKFDRAGLTTEISKVRKQLQELTGVQERSAKRATSAAKKKEMEDKKAAKLADKIERDTTAAWLKDQRVRAKWAREQARLNDRTSNPSAHVEAYRRQQAAQAKLDDKVNRDAAAAALKDQRVRDRWRTEAERAEARAASRRMREMRVEADFMNREFNLRRAAAANIHSEALRMNNEIDRQRRRQRLLDHTEAIRLNREMDAQLRRRPTSQVQQRAGGGGNTNPWHIGGVAGGLGGLITRGNLAAVGAGAGLQQMYTTANFTAAREPIYEFLTGSKEGGAKQIKYVNDLVDELHLDLIATDKSYTQFLGAVNSSIGADKAQKTFKTIQSFGVMMGASPESLQRGTKAIQQMLSKQKLSAEELTGFSLAGLS